MLAEAQLINLIAGFGKSMSSGGHKSRIMSALEVNNWRRGKQSEGQMKADIKGEGRLKRRTRYRS